MKDRLECYLLEHSYQKISSNIPQISLYSFKTDAGIHLISVVEYSDTFKITTEQYEITKNRAIEFFKSQGFDTVPLLTVVLSEEPMEARKFVLVDKYCWIVDSKNQILYIYEDQITDFFGVRKIVEAACEMHLAPPVSPSNTVADRILNSDFYQFLKEQFSPVNSLILFINLMVFLILAIKGDTLDVEYMLTKGALYVPYITEKHEFYRFITCMFIHFGYMHVAGNMIALLFLGCRVEKAIGSLKYSIVYLAGGILGSIGSFVYSLIVNPSIVSAGASGAIFAIVGTLLIIVIKNHGHHEDISTFRMFLLIMYLLYIGMTRPDVDNAAHICGLIGGCILGFFLYQTNRRRKKSAEGEQA